MAADFLDFLFQQASQHRWQWSVIVQQWPETGAAFPNGLFDVFQSWAEKRDDRLKSCITDHLSVSKKIETLIMISFDMPSFYQEGLALALQKVFLDPVAWSWGLRLLYRRADLIWRLCADTSITMAFYTKRICLASLYFVTFGRWLFDTSPCYQDTRHFLQAQLAAYYACHHWKEFLYKNR